MKYVFEAITPSFLSPTSAHATHSLIVPATATTFVSFFLSLCFFLSLSCRAPMRVIKRGICSLADTAVAVATIAETCYHPPSRRRLFLFFFTPAPLFFSSFLSPSCPPDTRTCACIDVNGLPLYMGAVNSFTSHSAAKGG